MKQSCTNLFTLFVLILITVSTLYGQGVISSIVYDQDKRVYNQIAPIIHGRYGDQYDFAYIVFDTLIQDYKNWNSDVVQDPYGTLKGCILFSVVLPSQQHVESALETPQDSNIVGMIKNGQIIWDNYPGDAKECNNLVFTQDLNNDGEVDLAFAEIGKGSMETKPGDWLSFLHILSWNGLRGRFISAYMEGTDEDYYPIDIDGDGIMEIRASLPDNALEGSDELKTSTFPLVTYGWNGSQYGLWAGVRQIKDNEFLPANRMKVSIKCSVEKQNDKYKYSYIVSNDSTSKQKISNIYVGGLSDTTHGQAPSYWTSTSSRYIGARAFIGWSPRRTCLINPGKTLGGFLTISSALPSIVKYYVQGHNEIVALGTDEQKRQDIYNNSVTGYTLGTRDTFITFGALEWCDTLSNYANQSFTLGWIKTQSIRDKYLNYFASAKTKLVQRDSVGARTILLQVLKDVDIDSTASLSSETYALLRYNTEYLANILPQAQAAPFFAVKLVSSNGTKLTSGALQYYEGAWKDATNNQDGTFSINTSLKTLSLRMTYEYGTQTKSNMSIRNDTIVFQTVNAQIQLQNSSGAFIDTGSVQYYAGAWRILGTTINGTATKELLPANYSFKMSYAYASKDKQQDISTNATVVFQTVNAVVQLQNSQGSLIDQGTVQYYSGAWRDIGTTTNGVATKELLPNNYSFRMSYAYASKDKQQDISTNATVVFQTVNATVQLQNSHGAMMDQGTVQYYSGAWRDFGTTTNGVANKELLPNNYSFRISYAYASKDKQQDISTNATVVFQTVNAAVQLQNSQGTLSDQGTVQYYSGAWRDFGTTANGVANKELLPNNYLFRISYAYASKDKQQDIGANSTVVFQTVNAAVQLQNSQGTLMDQGTVQYYSGAWRDFGTTANGVANKELLPNNYSFRMTYAFASKDKQQDIGTNATVVFQTVNTSVQLKNSLGNLIDQGTVQYYSGAWRILGTTTNGTASKELLPNNYSFRMTYEYVSVDKAQDISTNSIVSFLTVLCTIKVKNSLNQPVDNALASYYSGAWRQIGNTVNGEITKELLPVNLSFRVKYGTQQQDKQQNLSTNNVVEFGIQ